ncbi:carbohydrate-binding protein [Fulvivirga ulvae]|uniref:pectate lyase family protein n=1 Tax=Fulvivirga ulvae TaxID=2904245 RepID=UPI001F187679|nr:carbohydrate-binding protein [Fulvivirga ulvae]UII31811.1 carbohydrate-binding protein [Fulvivirga ulvae]
MKNKTLIVALLLALSWTTSTGTDYYVATNGSDSNSGTSVSSPFATLQKAVGEASAGDYIYLRGGVHVMSASPFVITKNGSSSARIYVFAYSGENPILQFNNSVSSSNRGVVLDGDYWHWKGITIERAGDNGMLLSGNNNIIENCIFRRNNDTGLQLSRYNTSATSISQWPSNNLIIGCEAYDNKDPDNEDADGFAAKLTSGTGNVFRNCVSHHNIDDGWDLYTKSDTGPIGKILFENCIAHNNGTLTDGTTSGGGDKNGFKLGSSAHNIDHELRRCIAYNNGKHGFTDNGNVGNIKFYNLTSYNNVGYNYHTRDNASHTFRNCVTLNGGHTDRIVGDASLSCNALDDTDTNWTITAGSSDFQTLNPGPNSNPTSNGFLNLASSSALIDNGCSVSGVSSNGSAPDLGAIEYGGSTPPPSGDTYTLTTSVSGSGSVSGAGTYDEGTTATVTATPAQGWSFSNWTGDASGSNTTVSIVMNSDKSVTAVFTQNVPPPTGDGDRIEDTDSRLISFDGSIKSYANADNGQAINLSNDPDKRIVWNYSSTSSSQYTITVRYTRKASMNPSVDIDVNGNRQTVSLPETAGSEFATTAFTASLASGNNTITLITNADGESADIDWIEFGGGDSTPPQDNDDVIALQENETGFCAVDGMVDNIHSGYTGSGFADTENVSGSGVQYKVNASAGQAGIEIRYANGSTSDRSANILVNGSIVISGLSMPATGAWTSWATTSANINLASGTNDITIVSTTSGGLGNIDYLQITGPSVSAASCTSSAASVNLTASAGDGQVSLSWASNDLGSGYGQEVYRDTDSDPSGRVRIAVVNAGVNSYNDEAVSNGTQYYYWIKGRDANGDFVNSNAAGARPAGAGNVDNSTMTGFATVPGDGISTTTGGEGGNVITISNLAELEAWAASREDNYNAEIVYINGRISSSSSTLITIKRGANISILGLGSTAELQNIGLNIRDYNNVIVRNLKIREVLYPNDALTIDGCSHVWIDHCELHSQIGDGIGVDTYDGLLDIKKGSRYVTVSWCYLHDHMKCSLIGHTNNSGQQATDSQMKITYHHNYFQNTDGRNPSIRYGAIHMYNNYFDGIGDYGIAARIGAHVLVEGCHYNNVKLPMTTDKFPVDGMPNGYICESGNLFTGSTGDVEISQTGCDWWNSSTLPYQYSVDDVSTVASVVPANVGVGKISVLSSEVARAGSQSSKSDASALTRFEAYPNPFRGAVSITFSTQNDEYLSFKLYDMRGRIVGEFGDARYSKGINTITYENDKLKNGIYILSMQNAKRSLKKIRLIVQ